MTSIEFYFGKWCPTVCTMELRFNAGYVIFQRGDVLPDLVVVVTADHAGKVTASGASIVPS